VNQISDPPSASNGAKPQTQATPKISRQKNAHWMKIYVSNADCCNDAEDRF